MKWFSHDNDLSKSPRMQAVIADRGLEGYGQALVLLETLARETKNDGAFQFLVPLLKPTDLKFWTRELRTESDKQTERLFDVFEAADLIMPWRSSRAICSPMLGERADEWSKRKNKARSKTKGTAAAENGNKQEHENKDEHRNENEHTHQHQHKSRDLPSDSRVAPENSREEQNPVDAVVDASVSSFSQGKTAGPSDTEIATLFRKVAKTSGHTKIGISEEHKQMAAMFFRKWGQDIALKAWEVWLLDHENMQPAHLDGDQTAWPVHNFISTGTADLLAEEICPYLELGFENAELIVWMTNIQLDDWKTLTVKEIDALNSMQGGFEPLFHQYSEVNPEPEDTLKGFAQFMQKKINPSVAVH
jgi:hypothetical protein